MHSSRYIIGEHSLCFYSASERIQSWIHDSFEADSGLSSPPDLSIEIVDGYGSAFRNFDVDVESRENLITYRRTDYVIEVDPAYSRATLSVFNTFALKHALMNLYSAFIVHRSWGLLIHSSCVIHQGNAVLFSGHSGAGKSTVAKLSAPRPLLSNEATIVKVDAAQSYAFDSYPFHSDPAVFTKGHYPMSSMYFLHQSETISANGLSETEVMIELMDKVFFWAHDPAETMKLIKLVKTLSQSITGFELFFQKNDLFWREIHESTTTSRSLSKP
jgi:hypothetical protein